MKDTQRIIPCGRLHTDSTDYYLINPRMLPMDWEKDFCHAARFLVVPAFPIRHIDTVSIYACPREVVATKFSIEYDTTIEPITCELPCDILDRLDQQKRLVNLQGALS